MALFRLAMDFRLFHDCAFLFPASPADAVALVRELNSIGCHTVQIATADVIERRNTDGHFGDGVLNAVQLRFEQSLLFDQAPQPGLFRRHFHPTPVQHVLESEMEPAHRAAATAANCANVSSRVEKSCESCFSTLSMAPRCRIAASS